MTKGHLDILGHTLGINVYGAKLSKKAKDKKLPKEFYRNRFCAGDNHSDILFIKELVNMGYMESFAKINEGKDTIYGVTNEGIKIFRELFKSYVQ